MKKSSTSSPFKSPTTHFYSLTNGDCNIPPPPPPFPRPLCFRPNHRLHISRRLLHGQPRSLRQRHHRLHRDLTTNLDSDFKYGFAFTPRPLPFRDPSTPNNLQPLSFSTSFVFNLLPPPFRKEAAPGFAFVISASRHLLIPPPLPLWSLEGVFNRSLDRDSSHILAIEFATIANSVTIDVKGTVNTTAAGYFSASRQFNNLALLGESNSLQAWVDYNNKDMMLQVFLAPLDVTSKPNSSLVSAKVNLRNVILDQMYVGFFGLSGLVPLSSNVRGWSFRINGEADALDLSKLPEFPKAKKADNGKQPKFLMVLLPLLSAAVVASGTGVIFVVVKRMGKYAEVLEEWEIEYGAHRVSYKDLFKATDGFGDSELLGCGGFGKVYKGVLPSSKKEVAVKRVAHDSRQGMKEFVAEIASIGRMRHRNLVQLLGYCRRKDELLLVYDYMSNGSLDRLIFDSSRKPLTWEQRLRIIKGVASALLYLHEEWEQVVIHRDVKASNVMLDGEYNGRLGDFGLARLYDHGTHPQTTHVVGTIGYLSPELTRTGRATKATDVFAFGAFVLEVVCGRRPIEPRAEREEIVLVDWVVKRWVDGFNLLGAADVKMDGVHQNEEAMEMVMKLGLLCVHMEEGVRPSMREVVQVMEGDLKIPELPKDFYWNGCVGGSDGGRHSVLCPDYSGAVSVPWESDTFPFGGR